MLASLIPEMFLLISHDPAPVGFAAHMVRQAAGSSLLSKITHCLVGDALRIAGLQDLGAVTVLPLATGMALTMTLLALTPPSSGARRVLWWVSLPERWLQIDDMAHW